jgi:hypothetical protein
MAGNSIYRRHDASSVSRQAAPSPPTQINVVLTWFEELKRRVPR